MEIKINSWGFVFESGWVDLYLKKETLIVLAVISVGGWLYSRYKG